MYSCRRPRAQLRASRGGGRACALPMAAACRAPSPPPAPPSATLLNTFSRGTEDSYNAKQQATSRPITCRKQDDPRKNLTTARGAPSPPPAPPSAAGAPDSRDVRLFWRHSARDKSLWTRLSAAGLCGRSFKLTPLVLYQDLLGRTFWVHKSSKVSLVKGGIRILFANEPETFRMLFANSPQVWHHQPKHSFCYSHFIRNSTSQVSHFIRKFIPETPLLQNPLLITYQG